MRITKDMVYAPSGMQLDVYAPDTDGFDTVLWFHGGGLESGCRADGDALARNAVRHGFGFATADYRLYPRAAYPDFLLDAAWAAAFIQRRAAQFGGNGRLIIAGQSAGAYMTMMLALNDALLRNAGADADGVTAYVADSAQQTTHYNVLRQRGVDTRAERIDEAAPLGYTDRARLRAPLLLIYYAQDIPCRPQQNELMYHSLKRFCPDAPVSLLALPGGHCAGSSQADANGDFPFITALKRFVRADAAKGARLPRV